MSEIPNDPTVGSPPRMGAPGHQPVRPESAGDNARSAETAEAGGSTLLHGISQLVSNDPAIGEGPLGLLGDAAVIIEGDRVVWVGPRVGAPSADHAVDLGNRAVLPGWVDSHSHLVFAGDRAEEFSARMAGEPYAAGGIATTVAATRAANRATLLDLARTRVQEMVRGGTTTIETKTGYGLTVGHETTAAAVAAECGADAVTFLGAHVVPPEFDGETQGYLDLVCGPMLQAVERYVQFIDVFCEDGAFDGAQTRRVLAAGQRAGLGLKVHGNQLSAGEGIRLAVEHEAVSVDHCTFLAGADVDALAGSATVATLLPACDLSTRQPPAPGRRLADAGARIALASNCNPGSCYTSSMNLVVALGVLQCGLTAAEAVQAATMGGAAALRLTDVGFLAPGARADIHVLDAPSYDHLAYRVGMPLTHAVWRKGVQAV